jgi:hypothetical protein
VFVVLGNFHDHLGLLPADGTGSNLEHLPEESLFKVDHPQNCPLGVEDVRFRVKSVVRIISSPQRDILPVRSLSPACL